MIDGPVQIVGGNGNVSMPAGSGPLGTLHRAPRVVGGSLRPVGKAQQGADGLCRALGLLGFSAVDAHMVQAQAQHDVHRLPGQAGNLIPLLPLNQRLVDHPGAAAGENLVKGEVVHQVLGVDAAGGHPFQTLIGSRHGPELGHTAVLLGGEEFYRLQAQRHGLLHLAGGGGAGQHQRPLGLDIAHRIRVEPGADDKLRPGGQGPVHLFAGEDGARPHQHFGRLRRDGLHCLLGGGGAEGHLCGGQTARHQSAGQRHGFFGVVNGDYRNDADPVNLLQDRLHACSSFPNAAHRREWAVCRCTLHSKAASGAGCQSLSECGSLYRRSFWMASQRPLR